MTIKFVLINGVLCRSELGSSYRNKNSSSAPEYKVYNPFLTFLLYDCLHTHTLFCYVLIGNCMWMNRNGISINNNVEQEIVNHEERDQTVVMAALNGMFQ